jgi:CheY-like chemotaxis protein
MAAKTKSKGGSTLAIVSAALVSLSEAVIVAGIDRQVILLNRAAALLMEEEDAEAVVGHALEDLFDSSAKIVAELDSLFADPYTYGQGDEGGGAVVGLGDRTVQVHLSAVLGETGEFLGVVVLLSDITAEVKAEQARTDFFATLYGQLQSSLTTVKGYSDLLARQASNRLDTQQRRFLRIIQSNVSRLIELIEEAAVFEAGKEAAERQTVLVVEDEIAVAQLITLQLRQEGFDVLTTEWGEEAVWLAQSRPVDLITLDIMLPDISGVEVLRRLRSEKKTADIPVIVVSVIQPEGEEDFATTSDHISKPFAFEDLLGSIRRTLSLQGK